MKNLIGLALGLLLAATPALATEFCPGGTYYNSGGPVTISSEESVFCVRNVGNASTGAPTLATFPSGALAYMIEVGNTSELYAYGNTQVRTIEDATSFVFDGTHDSLYTQDRGEITLYGGNVLIFWLTDEAKADVTDAWINWGIAQGTSQMKLRGGIFPVIAGPNLIGTCYSTIDVTATNMTWTPSGGATRSAGDEVIAIPAGFTEVSGVLTGQWLGGSPFRAVIKLAKMPPCSEGDGNPQLVLHKAMACGILGVEMLPIVAYTFYRRRRKLSQSIEFGQRLF